MSPNQKAADAILKHLQKSVDNNTAMKLTNGVVFQRGGQITYTECAVFANELGSMAVLLYSNGTMTANVSTARGTSIRYTLTETTVDADTLSKITSILNTIISQQQGPTVADVLDAALRG